MLIVTPHLALSQSKIERLIESVNKAGNLRALEARFFYFVKLDGDLNPEEKDRLEALLSQNFGQEPKGDDE